MEIVGMQGTRDRLLMAFLCDCQLQYSALVWGTQSFSVLLNDWNQRRDQTWWPKTRHFPAFGRSFQRLHGTSVHHSWVRFFNWVSPTHHNISVFKPNNLKLSFSPLSRVSTVLVSMDMSRHWRNFHSRRHIGHLIAQVNLGSKAKWTKHKIQGDLSHKYPDNSGYTSKLGLSNDTIMISSQSGSVTQTYDGSVLPYVPLFCSPSQFLSQRPTPA